MYFLLTWSIAPGPTSPQEIEADMFELMAPFKPQCDIVPGHSRIFRGKDGAYDDLLFALLNLREMDNRQLTFALLSSAERLFDGDGFDRDLAKKIIK